MTILLLKDEEKRKKFLFQIKCHGEKDYRVTFPLLEWDEINPNLHFAKKSAEIEQEFTFFHEAVKLLGRLCQQRNYLCINMLRDQFSFKLLMDFINFIEGKHVYELKIVFVRLLLMLYIDVYSYSTQQFRSPLRFLKSQHRKSLILQQPSPAHQQEISKPSFTNSSNSDISFINNRQLKDQIKDDKSVSFEEPY